ncbi:MAG TPA: nuclease-related domain-containing protein [Acidimicrobiales bacterium]|nr:nuclease-related domain-containing protein [Acidimicrobiales bacterium]
MQFRVRAWAGVQERWRARKLTRGRRSAQYARRELWNRVAPFLSRRWRLVLGSAIGLPALLTPLTILQYSGPARWFLIGITWASGLWLAVLFTVLFSGAARLIMAIESEERTAEALRQLRRKGWRSVSGLRVRGDADIDHIAVGPAGVFVLETKSVSEPWPLQTPPKPFLAERVQQWHAQINASQRALTHHFKRALEHAPVRPVLVIWPPDGPEEAWDWFDHQGVTVVRGAVLSRWLKTLGGPRLTPEHVRRIWLALERHARSRDAKDEERLGPPAPTLVDLSRRFLVEPYLGFTSFLYLVGVAMWSDRVPLVIAAFLVALVGGLALRRRRRLRPAATGWLTGWATFMALGAIHIASNLI